MPPPPGMAGASFSFGVGDHGLGRDHETGDRRSVLEGDAHDFGRVDDAGLQHIDILLGLRVEAEGLRGSC
jgi:hypothetical protein